MAPNIPSAMANEIIIPFAPRTRPFIMFPSIKSVNELINGTPGIKNNTEVAKASSGSAPSPHFTEAPEISEAVSEPKKIHMYPLNACLALSCLTYNPANVAVKATAISMASPPNNRQNEAPAKLTSNKITNRG